jgi:UDP-N-acetyl-D-glucosamine/UDP-N-acetyl-D-galactosamine dehydrogenase
VAHREYAALSVDDFARKLVQGGAFVDVKAAFDERALVAAGLRVWRL